jgi:hypothetical protein
MNPRSHRRNDEREAGGSVEEVAPGSNKNARGASCGWQFAGFHVPTSDMEEPHEEKNTFGSSHVLTPTGVDH